jgi:hypothetical protein
VSVEPSASFEERIAQARARLRELEAAESELAAVRERVRKLCRDADESGHSYVDAADLEEALAPAPISGARGGKDPP